MLAVALPFLFSLPDTEWCKLVMYIICNLVFSQLCSHLWCRDHIHISYLVWSTSSQLSGPQPKPEKREDFFICYICAHRVSMPHWDRIVSKIAFVFYPHAVSCVFIFRMKLFGNFFGPFWSLDNLWQLLTVTFFDWSCSLGGDRSGHSQTVKDSTHGENIS